MEEILRALVLGIVQGLTEFLPVSSSGHLELVKFFTNDTSLAEESMLITVLLHAATALSTMIIFRKDILEIFKGLFQFQWNEEMQFSVKIILSMIPAVIIGLLFEKEMESLFDKQIILVAGMLVLTGVLLLLADRAKKTQKPVSFRDAAIIGIAQAIAILPGLSRSGATISTSVLLGVDREKAARFSFLMVVPLIFGKISKDILTGDIERADNVVALMVGFGAAFVTGLFACTWMIQIVKNSKLTYFSIYCFTVAAVVGLYLIVNG